MSLEPYLPSSDRVALITGTGRLGQIEAAIARKFSDQGMTTLFLYREPANEAGKLTLGLVEIQGGVRRAISAPCRFCSAIRRSRAPFAMVAMANKMARVVWVLMTRGDVYQASHAAILAAKGIEVS